MLYIDANTQENCTLKLAPWLDKIQHAVTIECYLLALGVLSKPMILHNNTYTQTMSRLRQIFLDGNVQVMRDALEDVKFLSSISTVTRQSILAALKAGQSSVKIEIIEDPGSEVPSLFQHVALVASRSCNAHYQQAVIVWYMLFDTELFGRWMLQNESDVIKDHFIKVLKEATTYFIAGHQMNGALFKPGDNLLQRRTGHFISWVRDQFVAL